MAIITVVTGSYCHGDEIIKEVSKRLNYRRIDTDLPEALSRRYDINHDLAQRVLACEELNFPDISQKQKKIVGYIETTLAELLLEDNVIVGGCTGYMIPGNIPHVLKVCIIANQDFRVSQAVASENISESEAVASIQENDKRLSGWANYFTQHSAYDEKIFDIVIPMQSTSVQNAIDDICRQAMTDALQTTDYSRLIAADFHLGAQVKLACTQAGHDVNVLAENGRVNIEINEQPLWMSKLESKLKSIASDIPGVKSVETRMGPKSAPPSLNPWDRVDIPPKILLVDDEKEFVHTLSERLKTRNIDSVVAYDGEMALGMVKENVPDVIILDLMMPGIDGIETLRQLKRMHPQIQVIILTGHGSDREKEMAEELGAFAYLHKPVNINDLAKKMKEAYAARKDRE